MAQFINRKDGAVLIRVSVGTVNGKTKLRSFIYHPLEKSSRKRRAELERVAADFREKCLAETALSGSSMTFSAAVSSWQQSYASRNLSKHTAEKYEHVLAFWWSHLNNRRLSTITAVELQSVIDAAAADHLPAAVADIFKPIRSIFSHCYRLGLIKDNPTTRVTLPRRSADEAANFWDDSQLRTFLFALESDLFVTWRGRPVRYNLTTFWRCFFTLAIYTGARRGELVALVWADIHADSRSVYIHATATIYSGQQHVKPPKTAAGVRNISLPSEVFDLIEEHRTEQIRRRYSVAATAPVFPQESGSMMRVTTPTGKFQTLIRIINNNLPPDKRLPPITLHGLRHSAASLLIASGMDVLTVARRLGHARVSHTLDIYAHAYDRNDSAAADLLADVLSDDDDEDDEDDDG